MSKKTPERTCVACKAVFPKANLLRIVKDKEGNYSIDINGKANGRGAYICKNEECITRCFKKKMLNKTFKSDIKEEVYAKLREEYEHSKD